MPLIDRPGTDDIGLRMSIRMHDPEGGYRDILGTLVTPTSIQKKDGSIVNFDPERIALWRKVAPRVDRAGKGSPLSMRIDEIERAAAATWPASEEVSLGNWILRASGKFTMRANSVLALGEPKGDIQDAIGKVIEFYRERDLTPTIHIALPTYVELDELLAKQGWDEKLIVHVMVADLEDRELEAESLGEWEFSNSPSEEWIELQSDEGVRAIMESFPAVYASLRIGNELVATGRAANFEKWAVLTRLYVSPQYRGKGLGKELVTQLLNGALKAGATKALLQVDSKNSHAIALYKKMGFTLHHAYKYRVLQACETRCEC